jgi:hypothetical protein
MIPPPSPVFHGPPARAGRDTPRRLLWAATPVWSLGFLAWVPSLRAAIGRRTVGSWAWFALFAAATAAEFAMLGHSDGSAGSGGSIGTVGTVGRSGGDSASAKVGGYIIALMAAAAVHGFLTILPRGMGPRGRGPVTYLQGFGHRHDYGYAAGPTQPMGGYAGYGQPYPDRMPYPMDRTPYPMDQVPYPMDQTPYPRDRMPAADDVPPAADSDAAEVRAGLRELRETLERGEER